MNQNVQLKENKPKFSAMISSKSYQELIKNTLGNEKRATRFVAAITSAVAVSPALQGCEAPTVIAGALLGESLNLSPSPQLGQYYLVPFKKKIKNADGSYSEVTNATFVIGYKGLIQLAIRSGQYADIDVRPVHEGEYIGMDGSNGRPKFNFSEDAESKPVIGYMASFEYLNGFQKTMYWSKEKMLAHADRYSQAFNAVDYKRYINNEIPERDLWKYSSFWYKDFDAMACKTMLRQLITKWGVMSIEFQNAFEYDGREVVVNNDSGNDSAGTLFMPGDYGDGLTEYQEEQKDKIEGMIEGMKETPNVTIPEGATASRKTVDMKNL